MSATRVASCCSNAWIESFNSRLRDELLNLWVFNSVLEAHVLIEHWRIDYNDNRPHSAHGDLTPAEFHRAWTNNRIDQTQPAKRLDHSTGPSHEPRPRHPHDGPAIGAG